MRELIGCANYLTTYLVIIYARDLNGGKTVKKLRNIENISQGAKKLQIINLHFKINTILLLLLFLVLFLYERISCMLTKSHLNKYNKYKKFK